MRHVFALVFLAGSGCGLVSGLDSLVVDASGDVASDNDATNDASDASHDASIDASDAPTPRDVELPQDVKVGGNEDSGAPSCVNGGIVCAGLTPCCTVSTSAYYGQCVSASECQ